MTTTTTAPAAITFTWTAIDGSLLDYATGDYIRPATADELSRSIASAEITGGAGVITVDGVSCYVD